MSSSRVPSRRRARCNEQANRYTEGNTLEAAVVSATKRDGGAPAGLLLGDLQPAIANHRLAVRAFVGGPLASRAFKVKGWLA